MSDEILIYISVKHYDHQKDIDRYPVRPVHIRENCYRILESSSDPEHEYRQFSLNESVRCANREFAENEFGLIAVEKCQHNRMSENHKL